MAKSNIYCVVDCDGNQMTSFYRDITEAENELDRWIHSDNDHYDLRTEVVF